MTKYRYVAVFVLGVALYVTVGCFTVTNMLEMVR